MASHLPLEIIHPIIQYALDAGVALQCCTGRHAKPPFDIIRGVSCASQVFRQIALARWFRVFRLRDRSDWDYASNIVGFWSWIRVLVYIEKTVDIGKNFKSHSPTSTLSIASLKQSLSPKSQLHLESTDCLLPGLRTVAIITHGHNSQDREQKRPFFTSIFGRSSSPSRLSCSEILDTFPQMGHDLEMTFDSPGEPLTLLRELEGVLMNITRLTLTCSSIFDKECDPGPSTRFHWRAMVIPHSFDNGREYGEFLAKELAPVVNLQDLTIGAYLTDYAALHNCSEHQNRIPVDYAAGESQNCLVCQREYHKLALEDEIAGSRAIATESGLRKLQRIRWASWFNKGRRPPNEEGFNDKKFNAYLIRRQREGDHDGGEELIVQPEA